MIKTTQNFCFSTLAFNEKYRLMAKQISQELQKYAPEIVLIVGTDNPKDFNNLSNVIAFELHQKGILHCYHDKRFVVEKALSMYDVAIQIDADINIVDFPPQNLDYLPSIIGGTEENMINHVQKYTPERLIHIEKVASKLGLDLSKAQYIGESLMIFSRDNGKEKDFLHYWGEIGTYLELKGIHAGSGNAIGLAALKIGWTIERNQDWETIHKLAVHFDASQKIKKSSWEQLQRRLAYHYRLNKTRLKALGNFSFYYG